MSELDSRPLLGSDFLFAGGSQISLISLIIIALGIEGGKGEGGKGEWEGGSTDFSRI
jgi:hypothetical protein